MVNSLCYACVGYTQAFGCVGEVVNGKCDCFRQDEWLVSIDEKFSFMNECEDTDNPFGEVLAEDCPF